MGMAGFQGNIYKTSLAWDLTHQLSFTTLGIEGGRFGDTFKDESIPKLFLYHC